MEFLKFVYRCTKSPLPSPNAEDYDVLNEALDNELLLDHILEKLDPVDLKSCRLVCSKWNRLAVKRIRLKYSSSGKMISIKKNAKIQNFISTFGDDPESIIHDSVSFWRKRSLFPFNVDSSTRFNATLLNQFSKIFCQKFKTLNLDCGHNSTDELETILRSQNESLSELRICSRNRSAGSIEFKNKDFLFPKLKYLCLSDNFYDDVEDWDPDVEEDVYETQLLKQVQLLESLLTKVPKENSLKLCLKEWGLIGKTVQLLEKLNHVKSVKMLEIIDIRRGEFKKLADAGVCLEFLILNTGSHFLDIDNPAVGPGDNELFDDISTFLSHQVMSLEMLAWNSQIFKFPPVLSGLKKLMLKAEEDFGFGVPLPGGDPIIYGQLFPNLEELHLFSEKRCYQNSTNFRSQFLPPQIPCTSLKKLVIRFYGIDAQTMNMISSIFPTITSLIIGPYRANMYGHQLEEELYSAIWNSNFSSTLEDLRIEFDDCQRQNFRNRNEHELEHLFSGVPMDEIGAAFNSTSYDENYDNSKYNSIFKFKNLKKLIVYGAYNYYYLFGTAQESFTDFSSFCIFGKMKKLEYLHIDKGIRQFSNLGRAYLKREFMDSNEPLKPEPAIKNRIEKIAKTDFDCYKNWRTTYNLLSQEPEPENCVCESDEYDMRIDSTIGPEPKDLLTRKSPCDCPVDESNFHMCNCTIELDSEQTDNDVEFSQSDSECSTPDLDVQMLESESKFIDPQSSCADTDASQEEELQFSDSGEESGSEESK